MIPNQMLQREYDRLDLHGRSAFLTRLRGYIRQHHPKVPHPQRVVSVFQAALEHTPQVEIARAYGVSAPRVSVLVKNATQYANRMLSSEVRDDATGA